MKLSQKLGSKILVLILLLWLATISLVASTASNNGLPMLEQHQISTNFMRDPFRFIFANRWNSRTIPAKTNLSQLAIGAERNPVEVKMELYYNVANEQNGQFFVEQLQRFYFFVGATVSGITFFPIGTQISIDSNSSNSYQCSGMVEQQCEASLLQYCIIEQLIQSTTIADPSLYLVDFLVCYYQSEHFTSQQFSLATQYCYDKILAPLTTSEWSVIESCSNSTETFADYGGLVTVVEQLRPLMPLHDLNQRPFIRLNGLWSKLATVNVYDAVCLAVYNQDCVFLHYPTVSIAYQPLDASIEGAKDFFENQLTPSGAQRLLNITAPAPNLVPYLFPADVPCLTDEDIQKSDICWTTVAHYCINNYMVLSDMEKYTFVRCTFLKSSSSSLNGKERVLACLPESLDRDDFDACIGRYNVPLGIQHDTEMLNGVLQRPPNQTVLPLVNGVVNYAIKHNVINELCYNYFVDDNLAYGCRTSRPIVQIFYETNAPSMAEFLLENLMPYEKLAPWQDLFQLELVPYGNTEYDESNGTYSCSDENQCHANWIHACLYKQRFNNNPSMENRYRSLQFLFCTLADSSANSLNFSFPLSTNPVDIAEACVNQIFPDGPNLWVGLVGCAHEPDSELQQELREKTSKIVVRQIPEVTIGGEQMSFNSSGKNLVLTVCEQSSATDSSKPLKPRACFDIESNSVSPQFLPTSIYIDGSDLDSRNFVLENIKPILELVDDTETDIFSLRKVVEWQFVTWTLSTSADKNNELATHRQTRQDIVCPDGDENSGKCLANRVLACGLRQLQLEITQHWHSDQRNTLLQARFVVCFYENGQWRDDPMDAANRCLNRVMVGKLDGYGPVWKCVTDRAQLNVLLRMGQLLEQNQPPITKLPAVSINHKLQIVGNQKLSETLCQFYTAKPLPIECNKKDDDDEDDDKNNGAIVAGPSVPTLVSQLAIVLIGAKLGSFLKLF